MGADKSGDLILAEEDYSQEVRQDDSKVDSLLDEDDGESEPISIFSTADKRRLFIVEDIIKACAGCRPSFLFTGYVVERSPGALPSSLRLSSREKTIEKDLTLSLRYEPPSPKFSRSCPTSTSYRLKVSSETVLPSPALSGSLTLTTHLFFGSSFLPSLRPGLSGGGVPVPDAGTDEEHQGR